MDFEEVGQIGNGKLACRKRSPRFQSAKTYASVKTKEKQKVPGARLAHSSPPAALRIPFQVEIAA